MATCVHTCVCTHPKYILCYVIRCAGEETPLELGLQRECETTQMVTSVNWYSRELKCRSTHQECWQSVVEMISLVGMGKKPKELNWSSLAGTCAFIYYYTCLYLFVPNLPMNDLEYSST